MGHVDGFSDRDGLDKLVKIGKLMCTIVASFSALLLKKYPNNETITALLAAIGAVCLLLPDVEAEFLQATGDNSDALENPDEINGINEGLDPAPDPIA
jgi:hypothetical protein